MIRLKSLYVKDFRSIDGEVNVSLDAPIVLIHGPNGAGKTSLLSPSSLLLTAAQCPRSPVGARLHKNYLPHKDDPMARCASMSPDLTGRAKPRTSGLRRAA